MLAADTTTYPLTEWRCPAQMTGYMFRNAEYRRSLVRSIDGADAPAALPAVQGTITVKIAEGLETQVDAQSYMAELRAEVEGLRSELGNRHNGLESTE